MALSPHTVKLAGIPLKIVADPSARVPQAGYTERWVTQDATKTLASRDVPVEINRFTNGAGVLLRRDQADDGAIGWTENLISWMDVGLTLSGLRTIKGAGLGLGITDTAIVDSRPFNGDRYCITSGGCVIKFANDDPAGAVTFSPALNTFANPTTSLRAGYLCTAIEVFATATGVPALYVYAYNNAVPATRVYQFTTAGGWTESAAFTTIKISRAVAPVWWEAAGSGAGAQRLLVACTSLAGGAPSATGFVANIVRHCIYASDPMLEASYIAPIVTDPSASISRLLAFPEFAFALTPNGLWTFNEKRSMNLTPYATLGASYGGAVAALFNDGVFWGRGFGADFYDASVAFRRQDKPLQVGPSTYFQDGIPVRGQLTGAVPYEQFLVQSLYNHSNQTTYVGRAVPRDVANVDGPGPWAQYWAEHVIGPTAGVGQQVTHQVISSPTAGGSTVLAARTVNLWLFTADEPFGLGSNFNLHSAPLPTGAGPIAVQASSGTFAYTSTGRAYLTTPNWSDDLAKKFVRRIDLFGALFSAAQTAALYTRADQPPTTITDQSTWTLAGTADGTGTGNGPTYHKVQPTTLPSGRSVGLQVVLSTSSSAASPVVRSLSPRAKVARETLRSFTIYALIERNAETDNGAPDSRSPTAVVDAVTDLQDLGQQTYINEEGTSWTVLVEQGVVHDRLIIDDREYRDVLAISLSRVA